MSKSLEIQGISFSVRTLNPNQYLLQRKETDSQFSLALLAQAILQKNDPSIIDIIASQNELLIYTSEQGGFPTEMLQHVDITLQKSKHYSMPIYFRDSADWTVYRKHCQIDRDELIRKMCANKYAVEMYGFIPGFLYFGGLPERFWIPRKAQPVPLEFENTLAVGGKYLGFYSLRSPAGWYALGHCPVQILNIPNTPPNLLNIGDTVQLHSISKERFDELVLKKMSLLEYNV